MALSRACDSCGSLYEPIRSSSRYCSGRCRKRAQRTGVAKAATDREAPAATGPRAGRRPPVGTVTAALVAELREANVEKTSLGQAALVAAHRLDNVNAESASALAAVSKEFRAARAAALEPTAAAADVLDEMAKKRQERLDRMAGGG